MRNIAVFLIGIYQKTLSPDHGWLRAFYPYGCCVYEQTCSEYAKQIIMERGIVIGSFLTTKRLLSCNPWTKPTDEKIMKVMFTNDSPS